MAERNPRAPLTRLLTDQEVATFLAVQPDTVRRRAARGDLPSIRLGRLLRFRQEDVEAWVAGHRAPTSFERSLRRRPGSIRSDGRYSR